MVVAHKLIPGMDSLTSLQSTDIELPEVAYDSTSL